LRVVLGVSLLFRRKKIEPIFMKDLLGMS